MLVSVGKDFEWTRDLSTAQGEMTLRQMTLGEYLAAIGVMDPETKQVRFDANNVAVPIQRAEIKIAGNPIKERMLETILQGGVLPAKALHETEDGDLLILDGLQRTHVEAEGVKLLTKWQDRDDDDTPDFARRIMSRIEGELLSLDDYLKRPVFLQVWRNLSEPEQVRLFVVLNVGQQKVSMRHLLEALNKPIENLFNRWGIPMRTEKGERINGKSRAKWTGEAITLPPFKLEYLVNAARAYVERDHQVKTKATMEDAYNADGASRDRREPNLVEMGPSLVKNLMDLGDGPSRSDFEWACKELCQEIARVYRDDPKWRIAILDSDNFFFPLMAALGKARELYRADQIDERKEAILTLLHDAAPGGDPLCLREPKGQALVDVLGRIRSNIGRTTRTIIFDAWKEYFRVGPAGDDLILDWAAAANR
jgi:hypothetical protein